MRDFGIKVRALIRKDGAYTLRSLPSTLLMAALLCAGCLFLCLSVIAGAKNNTADKMAIGLVDKDGSMLSQMAMGMAAGNEEVAALFRVVKHDTEQQALQAVQNGETVAAVILEEGYFEKVLLGESSAIGVILNSQMQLHAQLIRDFGHTGEIMIKTGEYGSNAAWQPMRDKYGAETAAWKFEVFSLQFAVELLALTGSSVDGVLLPYSATADSLTGHYILHFVVLLLVLLDMLFFDFVRREGNRTLLCRLRSGGVYGVHLLAAKLPAVLLTKTVLLAAGVAGISFFYPLHWTVWSVLAALCAVLFLSVCGICLCALLQRSDVGPCLLCLMGFAGLFLCGGLVPYDMLPLYVTRWGPFTPLGIGASMLSPLFGGAFTLLPYLLAAAACAVLIPCACRYIRALCVKGGDRV